ncbi:MAG TPA: hypothetical protein VH025_09545, partial [Solirubrobacteraceae bacterium]|nr:hypothetical protein [Solirubrobacteraceae bacterium]
MTETTKNSHQPRDDDDASSGAAPPPESTGAAASRGRMPRLPSFRASAALAAGMLAAGIGIGAAIGPAPSASFAGVNLPTLLAVLKGRQAATQTATAPPA